MNSLIDHIAEIAACAAQKIISLAHLRGEVETKSDQTPVTQVDVAVSRYLEDALPRALDLPVISEECSLAPFKERSAWRAYWLIDPLDGTKDFIAGKPGVAVNISLVVNGRPALGAVAGPFVDALYIGWLPEFVDFIGNNMARAGAYKKEIHAGDWKPICTHHPKEGLRLYRSRSHGSDQDWELLRDVQVSSTLSLGSALKMCRIAEGDADVYVRSGPTGEWDTAATEAILLAAGGSLVSWAGKALAYNKESPINPAFVAMACGLSVVHGRLTIEK